MRPPPPLAAADIYTDAGWSGLGGKQAAAQHRKNRRHMLWGEEGNGVYADAKLMVLMHSLLLARTVPEVKSFVVDGGSLIAAREGYSKYVWKAVAIVWRFVAPAIGIIPVDEHESILAQVHICNMYYEILKSELPASRLFTIRRKLS